MTEQQVSKRRFDQLCCEYENGLPIDSDAVADLLAYAVQQEKARETLKIERAVLRETLDEALADRDAAHQALWDVYAALGYDTDGDKTPAADIAGSGPEPFCQMVVDAAKEHQHDAETEYDIDTAALRAERDAAVGRIAEALERVNGARASAGGLHAALVYQCNRADAALAVVAQALNWLHSDDAVDMAEETAGVLEDILRGKADYLDAAAPEGKER